MRTRQTITDQFSAFIEFTDNRFNRWVVDSRLKLNMVKVLDKIPEGKINPSFWTTYWHKRWVAHSIVGPAYYHLTAFVQESCYWSAHKIAAGFASTQYSLADCFQVAIAGFPKVLKKFSPEHGAKLDTYARMAFSNIIRDTLRQRQETDICSDWSLLRKISQKRLQEALETAGRKVDHIDGYLLAWKMFNNLYMPSNSKNTRQLDGPDEATWNAIAQHFNQQRLTLTPPVPTATPDTLKQWLREMAKAARTFLYPKAASLNAPKPGAEQGEWQDSVADDQQETLLDDLITQEENTQRQQQRRNIQEALIQSLGRLDVEAQTLLELYYGQGKTQQAIAKTLNVKQYKVSRQLSKIRTTLLKDCAVWSKDTLHISLTSDVLTNIGLVIEEWIYSYYAAADHGKEDLQ
ncbi:MAG: sigma-70 family RNA polymerase sigma factor [Cyanobacteria bacterium P01_F01_bin.150]